MGSFGKFEDCEMSSHTVRNEAGPINNDERKWTYIYHIIYYVM